MELRPFAVEDADTVARWPVSAGEVALWCGLRDFPVAARAVAGWQLEEGVRGHALIEGETLLGYGEVWCDEDEGEAELARIIVAPGARGRGVGRVLVRGLAELALRAGYAEIFMRVHPANAAALRCYRAAGFLPVAPALAVEWNAPQPVGYVWLRHAGAGAGAGDVGA
ncbi:GNAT family N-acetyltransferase [Streptomyces sp. BA2]|uniref:GNAT family N-acetyltransferase n=1 Tax=Streptomyces sp. BA2 TaxID=436595 RepID=UPI001329ADF1|nr:GNAT family N-acetyltransferase [Streptomyces sp. BA2]MWA09571.1 GNAT family N-acetyltransferase [Streptomyces sp. BA2]